MKVVLDSSAWIECFEKGPNAAHFIKALDDLDRLIVPVICLYEVSKAAERIFGATASGQIVASMQRARVIPLDAGLALRSSKLSRDHHLAMADALVYGTARQWDAQLLTQDQDFQGLAGVRFFPKKIP